MVNKLADKTGNTYGWLTVLHRDMSKTGRVYYICECKCGKQVSRRASRLNDDEFRSCGCYVHNKTHGMSNNGGSKLMDPVYCTWVNIKQRCYNPKASSYKYYGAQGVKVADEWLNDFEAFRKHVGKRPSDKHSIDRYPDNKGDYKPGNVRWATQQEQIDNSDYQKPVSGVKGIHWNKIRERWQVYKINKGSRKYVGSSKDLDEAKAMSKAAHAEIL